MNSIPQNGPISAAQLNTVINTLVQTSIPFVLVNILGTKKETIKYTDKKTGQKAEFSYFAHKGTTLAEEADFVIIRDQVAKGEDAEKATRPSYKGKQVLVILTGMNKDFKTGVMQYEAQELHPVEEAE